MKVHVFADVNLSLEDSLCFYSKNNPSGDGFKPIIDFTGQIINDANRSFDALVGNESSIFLLQSLNNKPSSRLYSLANNHLRTLCENKNQKRITGFIV